MMKRLPLLSLCAALSCFAAAAPAAHAQEGIIRLDEIRQPEWRRLIRIPDVNGLKVLKCDFHMHTVFSDAHVWPNVRVEEVWREGLDVFSITDHLEYTPHKADVRPDASRAHEIAKGSAADKGLTLVKGAEITRGTPPGHFNALFIGDTAGYVTSSDPALDREALNKALEQGAYIFWAHPGWQAERIPHSYDWLPFLEELYQEKKVHGVEVANGFELYTKSIDWALDRDLAIFGNTDIHNLITAEYNLSRPDGHRTMTLVFAENKSPEAVRAALEARRTVAWAGKYLIGKEENVKALFDACVSISPAHHERGGRKFYEISNQSDIYFELEPVSGGRKIILYPSSAQTVSAPAGESSLSYKVTSTLIRSDKHLQVTFQLP